MAVVEVVEVCVEVGHVVDHQTGQLRTGCLNGSLSVVQHSEVRSAEGSVFILLLDQRDLDALRKEAQLTPNSCCQFLRKSQCYLIAGQRDKDLEVLVTDGLDLLLGEEVIEPILERLERKVNLIHIVPSIQVNDILILRDAPLRPEISP